MANNHLTSDFNVQCRPLAFSIKDILRLSDSKSLHNQINESNKYHNIESIQSVNKKIKKASSKKNVNVESAKRIRTIFTQHQLDALEANFERQQYMIRSERTQLAASLNLQEPQVKVWFQNRRIKWRKQQHEATVARIRAHQQENGSNNE